MTTVMTMMVVVGRRKWQKVAAAAADLCDMDDARAHLQRVADMPVAAVHRRNAWLRC